MPARVFAPLPRAAPRSPLAMVLGALAVLCCTATSADRAPASRDPGTAAIPALDDSTRALDRDDYGVAIDTAAPAGRIASLNPTTTELLFALGAESTLVARSRWDQWPAAVARIPEVGDAIRPSVERIVAARPDLVLLYASGDNRGAAEALRRSGLRVVALRVDRLADFARCVRLLGILTGREPDARRALDTLRESLRRVQLTVEASVPTAGRPTVFLHVWDNPLLAIGGGSYLSELVTIAGGRNVFGDRPEPSPQVSFEELVRRAPSIVLAGPGEVARLAAEPRWRTLDAVRGGRLLAYDTLLLSRPSLRVGEGARALARLLHPGVAFP